MHRTAIKILLILAVSMIMQVPIMCMAPDAHGGLEYGYSINDTLGHTTAYGSVRLLEDVIVGERIVMADSGYADSIMIYLAPGGFNDDENCKVKCALYNYAAGTPSLVDSTEEILIDTSNDTTGWWTFKFVPRVWLDKDTTYLPVAWSEEDLTNWSMEGRAEGSVGDTLYFYDLVYAAWPDPMVETALEDYRMSMWLAFTTVNENHLILNDSSGFVVGVMCEDSTHAMDDVWADATLQFGKLSQSSAVVESTFASADGGIVNWQGSHEGDSADWQHSNENPVNESDWLFTDDPIVKDTTMLVVDVDTSAFGDTDFDSVRIVFWGEVSSGAPRLVSCLYNVTGTVIPLDTFDFTSTPTAYTSRGLTGLSKSDLDGMQIGISNNESPGVGKSIILYRMFLEVFTSPETFVAARLAMELRETDSMGFARVGTQSGDVLDSAFWYLPALDTVGVPGYIETRMPVPRDTIGAEKAVYGAGKNKDTVTCHTTWRSWYGANRQVGVPQCGDTVAWALPGCDSNMVDYYPNPIDTFSVTANTVMKIDITDFLRVMATAPKGDARHTYNGMILLAPLGEDSTSEQSITIGNVGPFATADTSWIEIFRHAEGSADQNPGKGGSDMIVAFEDSGQFVLGGLHEQVGNIQDGAYGGATVDCLYNQGLFYMMTAAVRDTSRLSDTLSGYVIDSAQLWLFNTFNRWIDSVRAQPLIRSTGDTALCVYVGTPLTGNQADVTSCRTTGQDRLDTAPSGCSDAEIDWQIPGAFDSTSSPADRSTTKINVSGALTGPDQNTYLKVDVTEWADSLNAHSATWGNALVIQIHREAGKAIGLSIWANVYPIAADEAAASAFYVWASETPAAGGALRRRRILQMGMNDDETKRITGGEEDGRPTTGSERAENPAARIHAGQRGQL